MTPMYLWIPRTVKKSLFTIPAPSSVLRMFPAMQRRS
ncbi:hypothetical protein EVA_13003 [gut metagenome]|uniref:Uncharacterized protein n=1 Tax=gut metagenome TaxID=749906 RepID=J9GHH6_9ZZZZ